MKNTNHAPRYFADDDISWQWISGEMTINTGHGYRKSTFTSPAELLAQHGVYETDEDGRILVDTDAEAGERGDREYRSQKEDES